MQARAAMVVAMALGVALMAGTARGKEYFVAPAGSDSNTGANWSAPFLTISNAVAKGDAAIVTVSNGTYNITTQIIVNSAITVRSFGGGVYGGLANASNTVVQRSSGETRIFLVNNSGAVLDGFTITKGRGRGNYGWNGNGVRIDTGAKVQNCIIEQSGAMWGDCSYLYGAGVYMTDGTLSNCVVRYNLSGSRGGAGGVWASGGQIVDCHILSNTNDDGYYNSDVTGNGGGIYAGTGVLVRNCLVAGNTSSFGGSRCAIGGGIYLAGGAVESCTVVKNSSENSAGAGGVHRTGGTMINSIAYSNTVLGVHSNLNIMTSVSYCCTTNRGNSVNHNIMGEPLFVDFAGGDYRLGAGSPCINAGSDQAWMTGALDLAGNSRLVGTVDMGAYETEPLSVSFSANVTSVRAPSNVVFTATVGGTNTTVTYYGWDFGDGQTATGSDLAVVTNTYSAAGIYTVILTVSNTADVAASATNSSYITVIASPSAYSMPISFTNFAGRGVLTNFPALVKFTMSNINNYEGFLDTTNGWDLRFWTNASFTGDALSYEMELFDANGTSYIWVKVPELADETTIWATWGDLYYTQEAYTTNGNVWTEGFEGVWHFGADVNDSTGYNRDGADSGTTNAAGQIGDAQGFDGSKVITVTGYKGITGTSPRTMSAWVNVPAGATDHGILGWGTDSPDQKWVWRIQDDSGGLFGAQRVEVNGGYQIGTTDLRGSGWRYLTAQFSNDASPDVQDVVLYVDGLVETPWTDNTQTVATVADGDVRIGADQAGLRKFLGTLDEVRISSAYRSSSWVWACWMNQGGNHGSFVKYGKPVGRSSGTVFRFR